MMRYDEPRITDLVIRGVFDSRNIKRRLKSSPAYTNAYNSVV